MDIGLMVNTKWVVGALNQAGECWVIDYGLASGPLEALHLLRTKTYPCPSTGEQQRIQMGWLDCRYRMKEVFDTCLASRRTLFPTMGMPDGQSLRAIAWTRVPGQPRDFGILQFRDSDAKYDLYMDCIKDQRPPGLFLPEDTDEKFIRELSQEHLIRDPRTKKPLFGKPRGPQHWGDAVKILRVGWDDLVKGRLTQRSALPEDPAVEEAAAPPVSS